MTLILSLKEVLNNISCDFIIIVDIKQNGVITLNIYSLLL